MNEDKNIAVRIKQSRQLAKITQQELAERIGVSPITMNRWENPESGRAPNADMLKRIAEVLNVSVGYLMGIDDTTETANPSISEQHTQERNTNMATFTTKDGMRFEAPATPDGYAYLERMFERLFTASMSRTAATA